MMKKTVRCQEDISTEEEDLSELEEDLLMDCVSEDHKSANKTLSSLKHLGYRWGDNSKYWVMWTLWEPNMLDQLYLVTNLKKNDEYNLTVDDFNDIINVGFSKICSDPSFLSLTSVDKMRYLVVRSDFEENKEPFETMSEVVEIKASEVKFKNGKVFHRFQPIYIIACAGLAEILRAICKKSDLLIVSGTYRRVFNNAGKCCLLMNFDNPKGQLQILRLPFSDLDVIYMAEKIKTTNLEKRFQFKYFLRERDTSTRKEITRHQDFKWANSFQELKSSRNNFTSPDFVAPIQNNQDPFEIYMFLLSNDLRLPPSNGNTTSSEQIQEKWGYEERHLESIDDPGYEMSSPVFLAKSKPLRTPTTTPTTRYLKSRRFKTHESFEDPHPGHNMKRRKVPEILQYPDTAIYERPSFFEIVGKLVVMAVICLIFLYLWLIVFTPSCCINDQKSDKIRNGSENKLEDKVLEHRVEKVFEKIQDMIVFISSWIYENCGWRCILQRLGMTVMTEAPVV